MVETTDVWIRERTGICRRHIAEKETVVDMGVQAAMQALEHSGISAKEIDLLIVSTLSAETVMPSVSCRIQERIGAVRAVCFDLNAACSGFLLAYQSAEAYLESGAYKTALIIGSERLSNIIDWKDRNSCILFGDGAGAVLLQAAEGKTYRPAAHSDGSGGAALTGPGVRNRIRSIDKDGRESKTEYITMNGKDVFQFAVRKVPQVIQEVLKENELSVEDIDWFVLHQANARIVDAVARRLRLDIGKFPMNLQDYGNTSSASIPILLNELNRKGVLKKRTEIGSGRIWSRIVLGRKRAGLGPRKIKSKKGTEFKNMTRFCDLTIN